MSIKNINPGLYSKKAQGYKSGDFYTQKTVSELKNAKNDGEYLSSMRKLESQHREAEKRTTVVDQSLSYAKSLQTSRTKSKEETLQKKKLQYSYKKISSQIVRSKTSTSARSAASAAKREVMRLKRLKGNEAYDQEELEISIEHAKSMERIARKKVHHLQQEEMIERAGKGLATEIEEQEEKKDEEFSEEELSAMEEAKGQPSEDYNNIAASYRDFAAEMAANTEYILQQQEELRYEMEEAMEQTMENVEEISEESTEAMEELTGEMQRAMEEMMEDLDITDLAETMYAPDPTMDANDLKMLKIKHRTKEMKDITKADGDYLKAIFEKHEADKKAGINGTASYAASSAPAIGSTVSSSPAPMPHVTIPAAYGSGDFSITI